jgi:FlaA1/EpsC-like NDP-sugar epimerase
LEFGVWHFTFRYALRMRRRVLLTLFWLLTDALIYIGAYLLAYFVRVGWILSTDLPLRMFLGAVLLTTPAWLFVMVTMRNFSLTRSQRSLRSAGYIAYACVIGMAAFALVFYFQEQSLFSRKLLVLGGGFSMVGVILWHAIFDQLQRRLLQMGQPTYPLLVIGVNREAQHVTKTLLEKRSPFTPVAVLDPRGGGHKTISGVPVIGKLNQLEHVLREKKISHLLQCDHLEQSINLASVCRAHGITYLLLPYTLGVIDRSVPTESLEGSPVVAVHPTNAWWEWFFR